MKILYDHQVFSWQRSGGISRYFVELQRNIDRLGIDTQSTTLISNNIYINEHDKSVIRIFPGIYIPGLTILIKLIDKIISSYKLQNRTYDILHPTYYDNYFLKYVGDKPYIVTVYDMIHEVFPQYYSNDKTSDMKRIVVSKAEHIIAISHSTKNDLINLFEIDEKKITVIHLASSLKNYKPKKVVIPEKYLLYVGDRGRYKNFQFAAYSILKLMEKDSELSLVCVGGGPFTDLERKIFGKYSFRVNLLSLSDGELVYVYKRAMMLVVPSIYEGFGLPILEAMTCGCPVLCSDIPVFKEIGSNAAIYFNPNDQSDFRDKLTSALRSTKIRAMLIERGYKREKFFSWEKCALETMKVYKKVYRENNICH